MFQINRTQNGRTATLKNGIDCKVMNFETQEDAQTFANSCLANARCEDKFQGRKLPKYEVVAAPEYSAWGRGEEFLKNLINHMEKGA